MPFAVDGVYTPASGATTAAAGDTIYSATWNAVHTDFSNALTTVKQQANATTSVSTIAALKAMNVTATTRVFVAGYYAEGDGGGGWFYGSTGSGATANDGTIIAPNAGTGRWLRDYEGNNINVKWFGLKGDNTTESVTLLNAARDLAIAVTGGLYFPATTSRYLLTTAGLVIPDNTHGLRIFGDARNNTVGGTNDGSVLATTGASIIDMTSTILGGTGGISQISLEHLNLYATGASGKCIKCWNVDGLFMDDCVVDATNGVAFDTAGTAQFSINNCQMYAGAGASVVRASQDAVGAQNLGPGVWNGGQISATNSTVPVMDISGDPLGVIFQNVMFSWVNSTGVTVIDINGPASGTPVGSISFIQCHSESTYNTTNTGATFRVGNAKKFGTLIIDGGNFWGHGNSTLYQQDFLKIVAARNIVVRGVTASKLGATNGFSRSMFRLETTFPTANDHYRFADNLYDGSGNTYSDANGRITGVADAYYEGAWTSYTPTVTSGTGTITTVSATGAYKLSGKTCHFWAKATITTNGSGASRVEVTLPFTAANSLALPGANGATGVVLSVSVITSISATKALVFNSGGTYPGVDGWIGLVSGVFETT